MGNGRESFKDRKKNKTSHRIPTIIKIEKIGDVKLSQNDGMKSVDDYNIEKFLKGVDSCHLKSTIGLKPAGRYLTDWSTIALSTGWGCFQVGRMYMAYLF